MTDQTRTSETPDPTLDAAQPIPEPTKPPISKASAEAVAADTPPVTEAIGAVEPVPASTPAAPVESTPEPTPDPMPEPLPSPKRNGPNGTTVADRASVTQKTLLEVESYEEAEALLSTKPDLIEPARMLFGAVVPTASQNAFMDLAIQAAASDDKLTLADALQTKRRDHLTLAEAEVDQILEFASETMMQSPDLSLAIAILITDDLTRLQVPDLWQTQKAIVTQTAEALGVDALRIWEEINGTTETKPKVDVKPKTKPPKAETTVRPKEKVRVVSSPKIKVKSKKKHHHTFTYNSGEAPPRWMVASGFVFLLSMMSCGVCVLGMF